MICKSDKGVTNDTRNFVVGISTTTTKKIGTKGVNHLVIQIFIISIPHHNECATLHDYVDHVPVLVVVQFVSITSFLFQTPIQLPRS